MNQMVRDGHTVSLAVAPVALVLALVPGCSGGTRVAPPDASLDDSGPLSDAIDPGTTAEDRDIPAAQDETDAGPPGPVPRIEFLEPALGTYATTCGQPFRIRVRIHSPEAPLLEATIQDQTVPVTDGEHEVLTTLAQGLNVLTARARTQHGAEAVEHRAVLCGAYHAVSEAVSHAADLYLGRGALQVLARAGARVFDGLDAAALFRAMGPLYRSPVVEVLPDDLSHGVGTTLTLKPAWGLLETHAEVLNLFVRVVVSVLNQPETTWPVEASTDRLAASGWIHLGVSGSGTVTVELTDLTMDLGALTVRVVGLADDLLKVFPEYEDAIVSGIEGYLASFLQEQVIASLRDALARLSAPIQASGMGRSFSLSFVPSFADVTPDGVRVALDLGLEGLNPVAGQDSPGVLWTDGQEQWPTVDGVRVSLKDDWLNAVFHEVWRAGWLAFTVDQAFLDARKVEVDLVAGFLGGVLDLVPGAPIDPETPIALALQGLYPPVASLDLPVSGGVRLGVGDLAVSIVTGDLARKLLDLRASVRLDGEVVPAGGDRVEVQLHALDVALDVSDPDGTFGAAEAYLEQTAAGLLDGLGPTLAGMLASVPLPGVAGLAWTGVHVGTDRDSGGVLFVEGDLVEALR